jgi:hypothetical protein
MEQTSSGLFVPPEPDGYVEFHFTKLMPTPKGEGPYYKFHFKDIEGWGNAGLVHGCLHGVGAFPGEAWTVRLLNGQRFIYNADFVSSVFYMPNSDTNMVEQFLHKVFNEEVDDR